MQQLNCFKPREIFNINTHAQFKLERQKDSDDSEEASNNDEEEIKKFLVTLISISLTGVRIISTFVGSLTANPSISVGRDSPLFLPVSPPAG